MDWYYHARLELESLCDLKKSISDEDGLERAKACMNGFHELFLEINKELGLKQEWETFCQISIGMTGTIERVQNSGFEFELGVSIYGWFVQSRIVAPQHIRFMKDDYWTHIVRVASLGTAELLDCGRPCKWGHDPAHKRLIQHKGSLVFSMIRDFTLLSIDSEDCHSLGDIQVLFPLESDQSDVRNFFHGAVESLHRSNQLLHRSASRMHSRNMKKLTLLPSVHENS